MHFATDPKELIKIFSSLYNPDIECSADVTLTAKGYIFHAENRVIKAGTNAMIFQTGHYVISNHKLGEILSELNRQYGRKTKVADILVEINERRLKFGSLVINNTPKTFELSEKIEQETDGPFMDDEDPKTKELFHSQLRNIQLKVAEGNSRRSQRVPGQPVSSMRTRTWLTADEVLAELEEQKAGKIARRQKANLVAQPNYSASSCFVASAVFNDPDHNTVLALKTWRDTFLIKCKSGRAIIGLYNFWGPYLAKLVYLMPPTRKCLRPFLSALAYLTKRHHQR